MTGPSNEATRLPHAVLVGNAYARKHVASTFTNTELCPVVQQGVSGCKKKKEKGLAGYSRQEKDPFLACTAAPGSDLVSVWAPGRAETQRPGCPTPEAEEDEAVTAQTQQHTGRKEAGPGAMLCSCRRPGAPGSRCAVAVPSDPPARLLA